MTISGQAAAPIPPQAPRRHPERGRRQPGYHAPAEPTSETRGGPSLQFIEKSDFGVRAAISTYRKPDVPLVVRLFPMIHIGRREYFENIRRRLESCDAIMLEGVKSSRGSFLSLAYRFMARRKRIGLVTQHVLALDGLRERIVDTEMAREAFDSEWSKVPLRSRGLMLLLTPAALIYSCTMTRRDIAAHAEVDDLRSRDEILDADQDTEALDSVILGTRDRHLLLALERYYERNKTSDKVLAVVYGAVHMRAAAAFLTRRLGYRIASSEWETVFDL